jgi:hypothetical protein
MSNSQHCQGCSVSKAHLLKLFMPGRPTLEGHHLGRYEIIVNATKLTSLADQEGAEGVGVQHGDNNGHIILEVIILLSAAVRADWLTHK